MLPESKPIPDGEPKITALLRAVLDEIADGEADPNDFTPAYRAQLFPAQVKGLEEALKTLGPPKSFDLLERKGQDRQRVYTYRAAFADAV
jgi:hypothetical protein